MHFVEWKEEFNIGIKEIDIQHRGLFDLINKLSNADRIQSDGKYFYMTFSKLIEYAGLHFSTEERYMSEAGYPGLEEHRREHLKFLSELSKLESRLENRTNNIEKEILSYLKTWYSSHILGEDRDYIGSLTARGFK